MIRCKPTRLPLGKKGFKQWPLTPDSKYALEALMLDKMVTLYFGGSRMDRHVRQLGHLFLADGSWVQGQMLKRGMARVNTFPDNRAIAADMYALERQTRNANMGFLAHPFYSLKAAAPNALQRLIDTFQLIKGRALDPA